MRIIGHTNTKEQIGIAVDSAKKLNMAPPHMIFSGAAGCGKTTMAKYVASVVGGNFLSYSPDSLKNYDDVLDALDKLDHSGYNNTGDRIAEVKPTVLFFDEIHRMPILGQEKLGIAMEEFRIESGIPNTFFWVPYFTIIGATTDEGLLSKPFMDRFKLKFTFEPYSMAESQQIVKTHAKRLKLKITPAAIREISMRGRGVPRILVRYLERVRDAGLAYGSIILTSGLAKTVFSKLNIDENGLTRADIKVLRALVRAAGPVGLENLSIITNESPRTLSYSIEPYLIQKGLMIRKGTGRTITAEGEEYLSASSLSTNAFRKEKITHDYVRR